MTSNNSKGNESVRFKSSMSVDEIIELIGDAYWRAEESGGPDKSMIAEAKEAIHQYVTKKLIEDWKQACRDNWQCPIPEQYALDRIAELEKQLEEWKQ